MHIRRTEMRHVQRFAPAVAVAGLALLVGLAGMTRGADDDAPPALPAPPKAARVLDEAALAARIDELISAKWKAENVQPAEASDDAEFHRRAYLDLAGRIPRVSETRQFLSGGDSHKRALLIDRLLKSPDYARNFARVWRERMLPASLTRPEAQNSGPTLEAWLHRRARENATFDKIVRELLSAPLTAVSRQRVRSAPGEDRPDDPGPVAFYQAHEMKAENLAAGTARLFLGVNLECAQCHNHPQAEWTKSQFWEYAAFFWDLQLEQRGSMGRGKRVLKDDPVLGGRMVVRELILPGTSRAITPKFLDGNAPRWTGEFDARTALGDWVTSKENPFFARAVANKVWAHMFGIGILEPVDEPSPENPPSHPELLGELAAQFVAHDYDVKYLLRAIALSRTYQLSSRAVPGGQGAPEKPRLFARMALKGLTPEQLFDSIALATGYREPKQAEDGNTPLARLMAGETTPRAQFVARFADPASRKTESNTTILQALLLMNGRFTNEATNADRSELLASVVEAPFLDTKSKVETLYLATLSRPPRADEMAKMTAYVEKGGPSGDPKKAIADVMWALLNSGEFIVNH